MGHDQKSLMRFVFDLHFFAKCKCFRKNSESVSETKIKLFLKQKHFCLQTSYKAKLSLKESKIVFKANVYIYKPFAKRKRF